LLHLNVSGALKWMDICHLWHLSIMDHGAWKPLLRGYIFLHKELVIEAWRNAYYMEMFFFHVIGYPYLKKCIVILEKDVPYNR
jgi:hypothetical protein